MAYLLLLLLALSTPLGTYFFSNHMAYHFHYHPLAHSNQWFWKRDLSDEDLDWIAHQRSKNLHASPRSLSLTSASWLLAT